MKNRILLLLLLILLLSACNTADKECNCDCEYCCNNAEYTIEYKFYQLGYYSVSKITSKKQTDEKLIVKIPEHYNDGIHGIQPVYAIEGNAITCYIDELILPESVKEIEPYAFAHFQPKKMNLEYIEFIGNFAFNHLDLQYDLYLDNLTYAEDYAFVIDYCRSDDLFDFPKNDSDHKIYIGKNSIPKIAIDTLPYNTVLYEEFIPRLSDILSNFNAYNSENTFEISYLEYLGTQEEFLDKCKDLGATFIFTNCKFD